MFAVRVSNVAPSLTAANLKDLFSECGRILALHKNPEFDDAYTITFSAENEASVAVLLSGVPLGGKELQVQRVIGVPDDKSPLSDQNSSVVSKNTNNNNVPAAVSSASSAVSNIFAAQSEQIARTLYIGNLYPGVSVQEISDFFSKFAKITYVKLAGSGVQGNIFAFVEFATLDDASIVKNMNGSLFNGVNIKVGQAQNPIVKSSSVNVTQDSDRSDDKSDAKRKLEELKRKLAKKYTGDTPESADNVDSTDSVKQMNSKSRSSSRDRHRRSGTRSRSRSRQRSSRRHYRSRSRSRDRSRRFRDYRDRDHRDHRDRDCRYRDEERRRRSPPPRAPRTDKPKRQDPHEGMFWDGFQWIPAAAVTSLAVHLPGVGFGLGRNHQLFK